MKNINIIGAFDRNNYGDLLFPIIIEKTLTKKGIKGNFNYYGLESTDLSEIGAVPTKALNELCNKDNERDIFIVAGGEVTGADIGLMYMHLSKNKVQVLKKKVMRKLLKRERFLNYSAKKLKIKSHFPWIIDNNIYGKDIKCIYNTIGANSISTVLSNEREYIINNLKNAEYISVRDKQSAICIKETKCTLYPDSATYMSKIFTKEELNKKISKKIRKFIDKNNKKYICLQMNKGYLNKNNLNIIINEIKKFIQNGYKVVLLPIGFAPLHEDYVSLEKIYNCFKKNSADIFYSKKLNIYEIMSLISNSIFFAGTSLHGNITSMAFAVRHIGLNKKITKLNEYLKTWEIEKQNECIECEDLFNKFKELMRIEDIELEKNKNYLLNLVDENFNNIYNVIEGV